MSILLSLSRLNKPVCRILPQRESSVLARGVSSLIIIRECERSDLSSLHQDKARNAYLPQLIRMSSLTSEPMSAITIPTRIGPVEKRQ